MCKVNFRTCSAVPKDSLLRCLRWWRSERELGLWQRSMWKTGEHLGDEWSTGQRT